MLSWSKVSTIESSWQHGWVIIAVHAISVKRIHYKEWWCWGVVHSFPCHLHPRFTHSTAYPVTHISIMISYRGTDIILTATKSLENFFCPRSVRFCIRRLTTRPSFLPRYRSWHRPFTLLCLEVSTLGLFVCRFFLLLQFLMHSPFRVFGIHLFCKTNWASCCSLLFRLNPFYTRHFQCFS